jgi:hypothetical protein
MSIEFCKKCNHLLIFSDILDKNLPCECRIFIFIDEDGDKHEGRGRDFEEAAKNLAENYDSKSDYAILESSHKGVTFFAKDTKTRKTKSIRIFAEQVIEYSIREL